METAFIARFSPVEDEHKYLCELYAMNQEADESITSFIGRVQHVNQRLRQRMTDHQLLPIVRHNLHPQVQIDLAGRHLLSLHELQRAVAEIEDARRRLHAFSQGPPPARPVASSERPAAPAPQEPRPYQQPFYQ